MGKTIIYYFTGTGNSLAIARELAASLAETEIMPVAKLMNSGSIEPDAECVGFIYPVYGFCMPLIMKKFISKLWLQPQTYYFAIANCANCVGAAVKQMELLLQQKNVKLAAGFKLKMPGNYTPLYGAPKQEKQKKLFAETSAKLQEISAIIRDRKRVDHVPGLLPLTWLANPLSNLLAKYLPGSDKKFFADENCASCGLCAQVCPVANITMEGGKPVWHRHCEKCFTCLQFCPEEAIQYGRITRGRKRYHHPDCEPKDLMAGKGGA
ncbi:MAG: EFR1 family ferrodoxin [Planctomycetes bacterium]|nr:EFR1 family ferrodoxin [Planctomycetota bacterium]